jgi:type II secretory pathway pseudopilin PulG
LVELLVVIAIIAILAALIVGLTGIAGYNKVKSRLTMERDQIKGAIEKYHKELGFYPPDNPDPNKGRFSPLYYELTGTTNLTAAQLTVLGVKGIANVEGKNFLPTMKPSGSGEDPANQRVRLLAVPYGAPSGNINAWNYRSSKPDHNTETYDLWADVVVGGKKLTIANWQD